jgi:hypothetical protein
MKYRQIGLGWAAMAFPVIGLGLAASAPSLAQAQPTRLARKRKPARPTMGGSRCRAAFAQPCSRTILAMPGTLLSPRMGLFMSKLERALLRQRSASGCANRAARGHCFGAAPQRRSPDASVCDRPTRQSLCRSRLRHQFLPGPEPDARLAGDQPLFGARNARRHLAQRCEPDRAALLSGRALRHWDPQWRGLRIRRRRRHLCNPTWPGWPKLYRPEQGPNLPAEELLRLEQGADYDWPECYFDGIHEKLVLALIEGGLTSWRAHREFLRGEAPPALAKPAQRAPPRFYFSRASRIVGLRLRH